MGTLQRAAIRDILQTLYKGLEDEPNLCVTLEIPPGEIWVQLVRDSLNIAWPFDEDASKVLQKDLGRKLSQSPEIVYEDPGAAVTFGIELPSLSIMADVLDWLFSDVYKLPYDYQVQGRVEAL